MAMRAEGMERWGAVGILMESGRLLHKHYRLFLPFYLTLYIPAALYGLLQTELLGPSAAPLHYFTFITTAFTQGREQGTDRLTAVDVRQLVPTLVSTTLWILMYILGTAGLGAIVYTVAYIYSNNDDSSDKTLTDQSTIVNNLFKSLPHAFLRMVVTQLWTVLSILVLYIVPALLYFVTGAKLDSPWLLFSGLGAVIGTILLIIVFAFAPFIAVLEPANYGRQALKRSTQLVRIGREHTAVAIFLISIVFTVTFMVPTQVIATSTTLSVWEEIALGACIVVLNSVFSVYFGVVSVVTYFVYTSRFDAVSFSVPAFSAENPYKPLVPAGTVYSYT